MKYSVYCCCFVLRNFVLWFSGSYLEFEKGIECGDFGLLLLRSGYLRYCWLFRGFFGVILIGG